MGRLASQYAGLDIQARFMYEMDSEVTLTASQSGISFPGEDFLNTQDLVFEIHRMIPRVYALDVNSLPVMTQPDQELLASLVLMDMQLQGFNQTVTKSPTRLGVMTKGSSERTWELAEPTNLPNGRAIKATLSSVAFPAGWEGLGEPITKLLTVVSFQGFLLKLAPARGG